MTTKISLSDFKFEFTGYGHYKVEYTSPVTGKSWSKTITDMSLIDRTKNASNPWGNKPKIKDLNTLKRICKSKSTY